MHTSKRNGLLKLAVACLTILVCFVVFSQYIDLFSRDLILSKLNTIGLPILLILIPYFFIILSDSFGWKHSFGKIKSQISAAKLFYLRLATETLQTSLPGGAVYAEIIRPVLLKKYLRFEYCDSISANIITKLNILVAQVLFFILGVAIIIIFLREKIGLLLLPSYLLYLTLSIVVILPILSTYMIYRKNLLIKAIYLFKKIKLQPVKNLVCKILPSVIKINEITSLFSKEYKRDLVIAVTFFFTTWILMALESLVILKVIGVDADIFQVILIESLISFVRIIFFFIPGAVGPQDVTVIILFNLAGISDSQSTALLFVLLKRTKEFFWIITGYILLLLLGVHPYKLIKGKKIQFIPLKEDL
jgi:hypothetical protein